MTAAAALAVAAVATAILIGPGLVSGNLTAGPRPKRAPNLSLVPLGQDWQYTPVSSPEELIAKYDPKPIVVGTVEDIEQGRDIYDESLEPERYVVMRVRVYQTLRAGDPGQIFDGRVYVEMFQGPTYEDSDDTPVYPLSRWREAIPAGSKVMLFLQDSVAAQGQGKRVENDGRGRPSGAKWLAVGPQEMIFEYDGRLISPDFEGGNDAISNWDVKSIDDIAAQVKDYLSTHS